MRTASPPTEVGSIWLAEYETRYALVSQPTLSSIPFACSSSFQRHAIGGTVRKAIAIESAMYQGLALARMCSVLPTSIFQKMYARARPVTVSVRTSLMTVRRLIRRPFLAGDCFDIGRVEAYAFGRALGPRESLLAAVAHRDHRSRPVGGAAQLPEDVAGPPVQPDVDDALERPRVVLAVDLAQLAGRRGQEADAGAADHRRRQERAFRDLL